MEYEGDGDTSCRWCTWNYPKCTKRGLEELKIEGQIESIQTPTLLWSAREEFWRFQWKSTSVSWCEKLPRCKIIIIIIIIIRRPDLIIINKKQKTKTKRTCKIVDFSVPADHRIKLKECEKKDKYLDLARELKKKTMEHAGDNYTNCNWYVWNSN